MRLHYINSPLNKTKCLLLFVENMKILQDFLVVQPSNCPPLLHLGRNVPALLAVHVAVRVGPQQTEVALELVLVLGAEVKYLHMSSKFSPFQHFHISHNTNPTQNVDDLFFRKNFQIFHS